MQPYVNVAWGSFVGEIFCSRVGKALGCCFGSCVDSAAVAMCLCSV